MFNLLSMAVMGVAVTAKPLTRKEKELPAIKKCDSKVSVWEEA
jgi:hypothetical protein